MRLSPDQMLVGLGLAETTPGPLILVLQFVGFLAGFGQGGLAWGVLAAVLIIALPILWALGWRLTALRLGDARATAMGINTSRLRVVVLIVVSLVAATTVAFAGIIGFIGLVGPHIARMLVGEDQRYFLPASMAAGAAVMCAAHAVSLMIKPGLAIPIGIVTSLLGVPFFIAIVMTRRRALWT